MPSRVPAARKSTTNLEVSPMNRPGIAPTRTTRLILLAAALGFSLAPPAFAAPARNWVDMPRTFVVLNATGPAAARLFADQLENAGGHAAVVYESGAAVVYADDAVLARPECSGSVARSYRSSIDEAALTSLDARTGGAASAWNFARTLDNLEAVGAVSAADPIDRTGFADAGPRPVALERFAPRAPQDGYESLPRGAEYYDTSEFMAGSVAVGVWLLEDPGTTYDWTPAEQAQTYGGVQASLDNWVRKGGAPAFLTFFIEQHSGAMVSGTPILNPQSMDQTWIDEVLGNAGWAGANAFEKCFAYNNSIRASFGTNWCYSIFIVDSDPAVNQGLFSTGGYAWAYYGGPWIYMSRYSTWAYNWPRYYGVVPMHETGHIFMDTDEYNATLQYGGYLNLPDADGVQCIMNQNDSTRVCSATRGQLGWRDLDANGIIEPLDVPPIANLTPATPDPTTDAWPTWSGRAEVAMLANLNPLSNYYPPHDQTIARINAVEGRVDGGAWSPAIASDGGFDGYGEDFSWTPSAPLAAGGHLVEARAHTSVGRWSTVYGADSITVSLLAGVYDTGIDGALALMSPVPNPAHGAQLLRYRLPVAGPVRLVVVGVDGRPIRTLFDGARPAGPGQITWDGRDETGHPVPPAVYFVRIESAAGTRARKIVMLR
jgi:hypothetical protein